MSTLSKFPWFSWFVLILVCALFGWVLTLDSLGWNNLIFEQLQVWGFKISSVQVKNTVRIIMIITHIFFIFLVTDVFSAPDVLLRVFYRNPLDANFLSFMYILILSFMFSVIISWFYYLVRFFVLTAVALLLRTDLQRVNFSRLQTSAIIVISSLLSFNLGILAFDLWGVSHHGQPI